MTQKNPTAFAVRLDTNTKWAKGPHAFRSARKKISISKYANIAKKFLFRSGPVGTRSDIASKSGFFSSLFECNG